MWLPVLLVPHVAAAVAQGAAALYLFLIHFLTQNDFLSKQLPVLLVPHVAAAVAQGAAALC